MDFIAARGFEIEALADRLGKLAIGAGGAHAQFRRCGPIALFATDPAGLNAAATPDAAPAVFHLFDGQISVDNDYVHPLLPATAQGLPQRIDAWLDDAAFDLRCNAGVFVAGRLDARGLRLVTDPLGQYPIYYTRSGDRYIVSNVLRFVATVLAASGAAPTPSLMPCLDAAILGGTLGDATHFSEISRLPYGHQIVAGDALHMLPRATTALSLGYEEVIGRAQAALSRHVGAVAAAVPQPRLVATDLTGGSDSRLMLALLLPSPLRKELGVRSLTRFPHADANVAGALMTRYGLPIAPMPVVIDADPRYWRLDLPRREVEWNAAFTGGARQLGTGVATVALRNFVHFTGAFGELGGGSQMMRVLSESAAQGLSLEAALDVLLERRRAAGAMHLVSEQGIALVRSRALEVLAALVAEGITRDQIHADFYLRVRARSHFGLANWLSNKRKIAPDPFASPWMVQARCRLASALHIRNKVVHDLMIACGHEDLARFPMADKTWHPAILRPETRDAYAAIKPVTAITAALSPLTGPLLGSMSVRSAPVQKMIRDHAERRHHTTRQAGADQAAQTRFANERSIDGSQVVMLDLLDRFDPQHEVWALIDRTAAVKVARQEQAAFKNSLDAAVFGQIVSGMLWMLDQPAPEGVQEVQAVQITPRAPPEAAPEATATSLPPKLETDAGEPFDSRIAVAVLEVAVSSPTDGGRRLKTFAYLLDNLVTPATRTLVDLGAGHCMFSIIAARRGFDVTAVDARTDRLPEDLGPVRFVHSDVRAFDPAGFGVVAILGLLYHLEIEDQLALLRRCAYGAPVIVETQVHVPEMIEPAQVQPWHQLVRRHGYCGIDYPEKATLMSSIGNPTSFWHTERSLLRLFAEAGYPQATLIDPLFRSPHGARRFYLLTPAKPT